MQVLIRNIREILLCSHKKTVCRHRPLYKGDVQKRGFNSSVNYTIFISYFLVYDYLQSQTKDIQAPSTYFHFSSRYLEELLNLLVQSSK